MSKSIESAVSNANKKSNNRHHNRTFSLAHSSTLNVNYSPELKNKSNKKQIEQQNSESIDKSADRRLVDLRKIVTKSMHSRQKLLKSGNGGLGESTCSAPATAGLVVSVNNASGQVRNSKRANSLLMVDDPNMIINITQPIQANHSISGGESAKLTDHANQECFCWICMIETCFDASKTRSHAMHTNNRSNSGIHYNVSTKAKSNRTIFRKCWKRAKFCSIGVLLCVSVCFSFVLMGFLLRRAFNTTILIIEPSDDPSLSNMTMTSAESQQLTHISENSEKKRSNVTKLPLQCNLCYFVVWSATSCMLFTYPLFLLWRWCWLHKRRTASSKRQHSSLVDYVRKSMDVFTAPRRTNNKASMAARQMMNKARASKRLSRDFFLKIGSISFIWVLAGYSYLKAIQLLHFTDIVILFTVNYSFIYMANWIILHAQFVPIKVNMFVFILKKFSP
jgi:hypothetical protein